MRHSSDFQLGNDIKNWLLSRKTFWYCTLMPGLMRKGDWHRVVPRLTEIHKCFTEGGWGIWLGLANLNSKFQCNLPFIWLLHCGRRNLVLNTNKLEASVYEITPASPPFLWPPWVFVPISHLALLFALRRPIARRLMHYICRLSEGRGINRNKNLFTKRKHRSSLKYF